MAGEQGVSGELVLDATAVANREVTVALEFTPARATAVLKRINRRVFKTLELVPAIEGASLKIRLPFARHALGDTVQWQAYPS